MRLYAGAVIVMMLVLLSHRAAAFLKWGSLLVMMTINSGFAYNVPTVFFSDPGGIVDECDGIPWLNRMVRAVQQRRKFSTCVLRVSLCLFVCVLGVPVCACISADIYPLVLWSR